VTKRPTILITALTALTALLLLAVCNKEEVLPKKPEGQIIARVGNAWLTLEELKESIPGEYAGVITREQNVQYVRQWINTELLYQEAMRLGVDKEPHIKARLEKTRKDLLSAEVLSRGAHSGGEISPAAVREYYESNREQFVRDVFTVRYEEIVVDDLNLAWEIRRNATHEGFRKLAIEHSKFPIPGGPDDNPPYVPLEAIPPVIRTAVLNAAVPSITGPYRAEDGFHILRTVGRFDKGTVASLEEVRDDIVSKLSNITQKGETERMISDVRSRADVEFNIELVPGVDSVSPSPATDGQS